MTTRKLSSSFHIVKACASHAQEISALAGRFELSSLSMHDARSHGFLVSSYSEQDYAEFARRGGHFHVVLHDSQVASFLLGYTRDEIRIGTGVDDHLADRYQEPFLIIKQICVRPDFAQQGLASSLYNHALKQVPLMRVFAAIVLEPLNLPSIRFHEKLQFEKVFELTPPDGLLRGVWSREQLKMEGIG